LIRTTREGLEGFSFLGESLTGPSRVNNEARIGTAQVQKNTVAGILGDDFVWIAHGPVFVADVVQTTEIARNILHALNQSTRGVPHPSPTEWKSVQAPMLEAAGAKTWAVLAKGSKVVGLECEGELVTMVPSSGYENEGGVGLSDEALKAELSAEDIGERLVEAFDACN
jgi:hypothetical protein